MARRATRTSLPPPAPRRARSRAAAPKRLTTGNPDARLVNGGREYDGDLRIADGRIAEIGAGLSAHGNETVVDTHGLRLLPGMIDDHVHFREPGLEYKADIATESTAAGAGAGGLTTFMDIPNTTPPTLDADALEDKYRRAHGRAWGNYGFYLGASNDNLAAIQRLDPRTTLDEKARPYTSASSGLPLVQYILNAALELVHEGRLTTAQVVQKFAHAPAQLFDVAGRGFLREGYAADLVLVDDTAFTVRRENVLSKCGWSPFEGRTFHSRIASTWVNGVLAWDGSRLVGAPQGRRLAFAR